MEEYYIASLVVSNAGSSSVSTVGRWSKSKVKSLEKLRSYCNDVLSSNRVAYDEIGRIELILHRHDGNEEIVYQREKLSN